MKPYIKLNIAYHKGGDGQDRPVITDDRGHELPNLVAVKVESRVDEPNKVTIEMLAIGDAISLN